MRSHNLQQFDPEGWHSEEQTDPLMSVVQTVPVGGGCLLLVLVWITFAANTGLKSIQLTVKKENERRCLALMTKHEVSLRAKVSAGTSHKYIVWLAL